MILTSMDAPLDPDQLKSSGFAGQMTKPVRQSLLFDAIMAAMANTGLSPGRREPPTRPPAGSGVAASATHSRGARILLAEDNQINQMVASEIYDQGRLFMRHRRRRRGGGRGGLFPAV